MSDNLKEFVSIIESKIPTSFINYEIKNEELTVGLHLDAVEKFVEFLVMK